MTIRFIDTDTVTLLEYEPTYMEDTMLAKLGIAFDDNGHLLKYNEDSIPESLQNLRPLTQIGLHLIVKKVFDFQQSDLVDEYTSEERLVFVFSGMGEDSYCNYRVIPGRILGIKQDVLIGREIKLDRNLFCVGYERRTSVMKKISDIIAPDETMIIIGGDIDAAVPASVFEGLLSSFPTTTELKHYGETVIESYLQDYLSPAKDYSGIYQKAYESKRKTSYQNMSLRSPDLDQSRYEMLSATLTKLHTMLSKGRSIPEENWQKGILEIIPTLFPQYIKVFPKAKVRDTINAKDREVDFLLIDANGNVDVLEIKRAFEKSRLLMKRPYRDNYIPARELSGGIAQIEKYIYYLLNWGQNGEEELTKRYALELPAGLKLRFLNPRGLLVLGHCAFNSDEQRDFDIVRKQYSHIVDIVTYDDMLERLERMLDMLT